MEYTGQPQGFFGSTVLDSSVQQKSSLDVVMYVASLASNPSAIEPTMDAVRRITAHQQPGQPLNADDIKQLADVYFSIENYLTHDEPLRAYTQDDIRAQVLKKFQVGNEGIETFWQHAGTTAGVGVTAKPVAAEVVARARRVRQLGRRLIAASLIFGVAGLFIPTAATPEQPWSNNVDMAASIAAALLLVSGAWLFLRGLPGFRSQFKTAYRLLCAAMVLLALAQSQQVIYTYFNLWDVSVIKHGGVGAGFAPSILLFYISMLLFARLLKVKGLSTSVLFAIGLSTAVAVGSIFLPHFPSPLPDNVLHQALPPSLFMDALMVFATNIVFAIKRVASPAYTPALAWLSLALGATTLIGLLYTAIQVTLPDGNPILAYGGISALFIVPGIFFVRSATVFNDISNE